MAKLYELVEDYMEIVELEEEMNDKQIDEIKKAIEYEINNKSGNIVKIVKSIESDVKAIDEEIKRLNKIKKAKKSTIDNIKNYTKQQLELMGTKKVSTPFGNLSIRKNPVSLVINDESLVPNRFIGEEVVKTINKTMIKDLLKEGQEIPGCELQQGTSLTIK